jgi:hypothetical protein
MVKKILIALAILACGGVVWQLSRTFEIRPKKAQIYSYSVYMKPISNTEFRLLCYATDVNGRMWEEDEFTPCQQDTGIPIYTTQPVRRLLDEGCQLTSDISGWCSEPHPILDVFDQK